MRPFDRSQLPPGSLRKHKLVRTLNQLEADSKFHDPNYRWATCCHEAAHGVFRQKAGATRVVFIGPHFAYNPQKEELAVVVGSVDSEWPPSVISWPPYTVAYWSAAGSIWERELCPESVDAEESAALDRSRLKEDILKFNPNLKDEEFEEIWTWAEEEVRKGLGDEQIKKEILAMAKDFEDFLTPWVQS